MYSRAIVNIFLVLQLSTVTGPKPTARSAPLPTATKKPSLTNGQTSTLASLAAKKPATTMSTRVSLAPAKKPTSASPIKKSTTSSKPNSATKSVTKPSSTTIIEQTNQQMENGKLIVDLTNDNDQLAKPIDNDLLGPMIDANLLVQTNGPSDHAAPAAVIDLSAD